MVRGCDRMSSDDGIYILVAKEGYYIIHAQAIENLWWWDEEPHFRDEINPKYVKEYFRDAEFCKTKEEAFDVAYKMTKELKKEGIIPEYGTSIIWDLEDKNLQKLWM